MKKQFLFLFTGAVALGFLFTSCKKDSSSTPTEDTAQVALQAKAQVDDQSQFEAGLDDVSDDANLAIEANVAFAGKPGDAEGIFCNATATIDSNATARQITITYNGNNCLGTRKREGVVIISMPLATKWKNAGASITVTLQALKVTRLSDNKSITITGAQTYTNVTGGFLISVPVNGPITHSISSAGLNVKFDDNTQATWQVAKLRTFSYNDGAVITTTGNHTEGNVSNIAEWGTNRFGAAFTTIISAPLVISQNCAFRLTSGEVTHKTLGFTAAAKFGLNAAGEPTGCPGQGNYFYKITWTGPAGNTNSLILPY